MDEKWGLLGDGYVVFWIRFSFHFWETCGSGSRFAETSLSV